MLALIPFVQIIELMAAIAAFIYLSRERENPWRWFKWFLGVVFLVESSGYLFKLILYLQGRAPVKNHLIYKIYLPIETIFHSWVLFRLTRQYKKIAKYYVLGLTIFFCLFFVEWFRVPLNKYVVKSDLFETLFLLTGCLLYYYYFLKQEHYVEVIKFAPFWIVTGMFFYHFVTFATTVFFDYLALINEKATGFPLRRYVLLIVNAIFYGSWVYAFKIRRNQLT